MIRNKIKYELVKSDTVCTGCAFYDEEIIYCMLNNEPLVVKNMCRKGNSSYQWKIKTLTHKPRQLIL